MSARGPRDDLHAVAGYLTLLGLLGAIVGLVMAVQWLRGAESGLVPAGVALAAGAALTLSAGLFRTAPWARLGFLVLVPLALAGVTAAAALELASRPSQDLLGALLGAAVAWLKVGLGVRLLRRPDVVALFEREERTPWRTVGATFLGAAAALGLFAVFAGTTAGVLLTRVALRPAMGVPELLLTGVGAMASGLVAAVGLGLGVGFAHRRRQRRALTPDAVARVQALRLEGKSLVEIRDLEAAAGRPLAPWLIKEALSGLPRRPAQAEPPAPTAGDGAERSVGGDGRGRVAPP